MLGTRLNRSAVGKTQLSFPSRGPLQLPASTPTSLVGCTRAPGRAMLRYGYALRHTGPPPSLRGHLGLFPERASCPSIQSTLKQKLCPSRLRPPCLHPQGRLGLSQSSAHSRPCGYKILVRRIIGCRIPHSMRRSLGQLNLGHPAYPRPKGTGDQSMPEKRGQARSASRTLRKTRVTWSRLDCLKSNPDRDSCSPLTRGGNPPADSVRSSCAGLLQNQTRQVRTMRYQETDPGRRDEWTT
jgi:hypothetical protein